MRGNELVIRPARTNTGGEFAEQILADLIARGYSGNDLLERFKKAQGQVRPAVEAMLVDAEQVASSESGYIYYEDVFGRENEISSLRGLFVFVPTAFLLSAILKMTEV